MAPTDIAQASWDASKSFKTKDGREIWYLEAGKPDGIPVLVQPLEFGTRRLYGPWISDAEAKGIRLIGYDRPGYEEATPLPGRSVADTAADVTALAKELGLERLMVWGWSVGGPHALACAALLPGLVVAAAALGSPAPFDADGLDWFDKIEDNTAYEFQTALKGRDALISLVKIRLADAFNWDAGFLAADYMRSNQSDGTALSNKAYANYILFGIHGAFKYPYGEVDDDIAITKSWGFDLKQIKIPLLLIQGETDWFAPVAHGKWLAAHIPHAETKFYPDDGHFSIGAKRVPDVHDWLLSQWK